LQNSRANRAAGTGHYFTRPARGEKEARTTQSEISTCHLGVENRRTNKTSSSGAHSKKDMRKSMLRILRRSGFIATR
jgi:hypothetical protein